MSCPEFQPFTLGVTGALLLLTIAPAGLLASEPAPLPPEQSDHWALQTEVDNIRIYTMDQPGSGFQAFKAEALMDVSLEQLMAVMANPESCEEWVHNCVESYAFGNGDFHDRYAYSVNDMPWPVTDRDYVLRIRTEGNADTREIIMHLNAMPDMRAEFDSRVRVDRSATLYRFVDAELFSRKQPAAMRRDVGQKRLDFPAVLPAEKDFDASRRTAFTLSFGADYWHWRPRNGCEPQH